MRLFCILAATAIVALSSPAFSQQTTAPQADVNAVGTVGPTFTANPEPKSNWRDPNKGRYGVAGGVGDPSVGIGMTGRALRSATVSLRRAR